MKRIILSLLFLPAFFLLAGCGSDPEVTEEETESVAVDENTQEDPTAMATPEDDLSELIAQVEAGLAKATEVGANDFFPEEFNQAVNQLDEAKALADSDPDAAREILMSLLDQGETLYQDSLERLAAQYRDNLQRLDDKLQQQEAPLFAPGAYQRTVDMRQQVERSLEEEDLSTAYEQYRTTYQHMTYLSDALANDIAWIKILIRDTETYMADAEEAEAFIYAEEELNLANQHYLDGVSYFEDYNLADSERELLFAKFYARKAAYSGDFNRRVSQTDELMYDVMEAIEDASQLTVVDAEGNIQNPEPWDGESALATTPLTELRPEEEDEEIPTSNLQSEGSPVDGTDGVEGETEEEDYLEDAKELWEQGVNARNAGDLELAEQYFMQAKLFVEAYESNAVSQVYTVRWREVDTDCLWRIAGYDYIYDNPFLWPKIWRRNKRLIENPDLIFPGQVLVIPPQ